MANKDQVISIHRQHPDWTSSMIAEELECDSAYVRATFYRNGMVLPIRRSNNPNSVYRLGSAALKAGPTVEAIEKMSSH